MENNFKGKKVAVLGFGVEGQDACDYLLGQNARVTVFDRKTAKDLGEASRRFKGKVEFSLGKRYLTALPAEKYDCLIRSPGFRPDLPEILTVQKRGAILSSVTKIFFENFPGKIIGVTGTKGKGTTSSLIYQILKADGQKVLLAGNIGEPMLRLLEFAKGNHWAILELSSFQLIDLNCSPHIAVVLMIVPEHQDYHHSVDEYVKAKANIVKHQKKSDFSVLNYDNAVSAKLSGLTKGKVKYFSRDTKVSGGYVANGKIFLSTDLIGKTKDLKLKGEHNWDNVCAAITAADLADASLDSIRKTVFSFKGLEYRLEAVGTYRGVSFYNDSFSTTPETAIAAIRSFSEPIILIAGGSDKGSDFSELGRTISSSSVKGLILVGDMASRIKAAALMAGFKGKIVFRPKSMEKIVFQAFNLASRGDIVLLSPACASFDMFLNYKDRGRQFKTYVKALKN